MYIRLEDNRLLLAKTGNDPEGQPVEIVLADLGTDAELNLFLAAELGRRKHPELWEGVTDFDLLQALETYKRRLGKSKPVLVTIQGGAPPKGADEDSNA
jgi:hypothetical protein